jgi:DNA-binding IclR family transcriptional regulator
MLDAGWVVADGRPRRYSPALRLVSAAASVLRRSHEREAIRPWLLELAERTSYPCSLCLYERGRMVVTDVTEVVAERIIARFDGGSFPAACTAAGKILLAFQSHDEIARVAALGVTQLAPNTITSPADIATDIALTRERGYALTDREVRADASGLGVPLFGRSGHAVAALGVSIRGPLTDEFVENVAPIALSVAARASQALGHVGGERDIA